MPKWALTPELRQTKPWGLHEELLGPGKIYTDPIHRDIYLTRLEQAFVDSGPFQRLRRVRQLGTTHLVYPAATHTRFAHALGALRAAQDLLDGVVDQRSGRKPVPDLFEQWDADPDLYRRRLAEATVLVRLGALLHDFCHIPYGHSIEDELGILTPHDKNVARFEALWAQTDGFVTPRLELPDSLSSVFSRKESVDGRSLYENLRPLILSSEGDAEPWKDIDYPFAADIVGNTISADLIDYLQRDHYFSGLPIGLGQRFLQAFYVTRDDQRDHPKRMALRIVRDPRDERKDTITELLKYLRYRYELSERALVHHAKLASDAMIGKALEMRFDALWIEEALKRDPEVRDEETKDIDGFRGTYKKKHRARGVRQIDEAAKKRLEEEFLAHGDDSLLDYLVDEGRNGDPRNAGVANMARRLLERRLFKRIGHATAPARAKEVHERWGSPEARRKLERGLAHFAKLSPAWQVVVWIPPSTMRLKAASVLVDDGEKVWPFVQREQAERRTRGLDIVELHQDLWTVSVFVAEEATELQCHVILARLAEILDIEWEEPGAPKSVWNVAVEYVGRADHLTRVAEEELLASEPAFWGGSAASQQEASFDDVVAEVRETRHVRYAPSEEAGSSDDQEQLL